LLVWVSLVTGGGANQDVILIFLKILRPCRCPRNVIVSDIVSDIVSATAVVPPVSWSGTIFTSDHITGGLRHHLSVRSQARSSRDGEMCSDLSLASHFAAHCVDFTRWHHNPIQLHSRRHVRNRRHRDQARLGQRTPLLRARLCVIARRRPGDITRHSRRVNVGTLCLRPDCASVRIN
jgi:hypothetical protein